MPFKSYDKVPEKKKYRYLEADNFSETNKQKEYENGNSFQKLYSRKDPSMPIPHAKRPPVLNQVFLWIIHTLTYTLYISTVGTTNLGFL